MIYAVIDTNVIVSAQITHNKDAATAKVMSHIFNGDITPLYDEDILAEYKEVLSRKKFKINPDIIKDIINFFLEFGISSDRIHTDIEMPDEDDRVFYEVSLSKEDSFLVTGNLKHYPITPKVISPSDFVLLMGF